MSTNILHITNGSSLTDSLRELDFKDTILTWQEMLCEGPTTQKIDTDAFFTLRKTFLSLEYEVDPADYDFKEQLALLDNLESFSEVVLWFEYDLFCHINMCAAISLLREKSCKLPISLVCSGRVNGSTDLKGLPELSDEQLLEHYKNKIYLNTYDLELAAHVWEIYCGKDHNLLKPLIVKPSSFLYLSNCLKAQLKRFPDSVTGLSSLEVNILKLIKSNDDIKSRHHLLGYILNYQGYYGFGDWQLAKIIQRLSIFFNEENATLKLNRKGHEALIGSHNFSSEINDDSIYGGIYRLEYQFNRRENKLIKTAINANKRI
jgi:hypothetical protein